MTAVTLAQANKIIEAILKRGAELNCRPISAVVVDLPHGVGYRGEAIVFGDSLERLRAPAANGFVVAISDRHVLAGVAIGGGAEQHTLLGQPDPPGVVVRVAKELDLGAILPHADKAGPKIKVFVADSPLEAGVAHHEIDPVVEPVIQVAGAGMGVADIPAGEKHLALVGNAVAIGVGKQQGLGGLMNQKPTLDEDHAGGNGELVRESGGLVSHAIAISVSNSPPACRRPPTD